MNIYRVKPLFLGNGLSLRFKLETRNASGARIRYAGAGVTARVSATAGGAALTGLGPFTLTLNDVGDYVYSIASALIDAALDSETYIGEVVFIVLAGGPDNDVLANIPYRVHAARYVA